MNLFLKKHILKIHPNIEDKVIKVGPETSIPELFNWLALEIGLNDLVGFTNCFESIRNGVGFVAHGSRDSRFIIACTASKNVVTHEWIHFYLKKNLSRQSYTHLLNVLILKHAEVLKIFTDFYDVADIIFCSREKRIEETVVRVLNGDWYINTRNGRITILKRDYPKLFIAQTHLSMVLLLSK